MSKNCISCGKEYFRNKWGKHIEKRKRWESRQFCSHECSNKSPIRIAKCTKNLWGRKPPKTAFKKGDNMGENHRNWKGGKPNCKDCGLKLSTYGLKYCQIHFGLHQRGENHPNWVNGNYKKSDKKWSSSAYVYWSLSVKNRDNWKCKISSENCKGQLESHHILNWVDYPELRYDINNGITLCHAHHPRGRAKEKAMVSTFMELLTSKEQL